MQDDDTIRIVGGLTEMRGSSPMIWVLLRVEAPLRQEMAGRSLDAAVLPAGYSAVAHCRSGGRTLDGSVYLDISLKLTSPPGILPSLR